MMFYLGEQRVDLEQRRIVGKTNSALLTPLEVSLLRYLASAQKPVSIQELHRNVWEYHPKIETRAVRYTVNRLRRKIEPEPQRPQYLITVRGMGYQLHVAPPPAPAAEPAPPSSNPMTLPLERNKFVGRAAELSQLASLLDQRPFVNVVGHGGTGKTRLVTRFAHDQSARFEQRVWFCDLSEARSDDEILTVLGQVLGISAQHSQASSFIGTYLAQQGRCLLILDNIEQITECIRPLIQDWLARAPEARLLATSRIVLGIPEEMLLELPPMPAEEGVRLFIERAEQIRIGSTTDEPETIRALVESLDGLPLAIELAVGRMRMMTPRQILERMDQRFQVLRSMHRSGRQATMRATLDGSWELLTPTERMGLAQLTVFEGGFSIAQTEAVVEVGQSWSVDILQSLIDKSMVHIRDPERFHLLLSVQSYAAENLGEHRQDTERRHGRCFAAFGQRAALRTLRHDGDAAAWGRITAALPNLRAACARAIAVGEADIAAACGLAAAAVLRRIGPIQSAISLLARTSAMPRPARRAEQQLAIAELYKDIGDKRVINAAEQALRYAEEDQDVQSEFEANILMGHHLSEWGDITRGLQHLERGLEMSREHPDPINRALALYLYAMRIQRTGEMERALTLLHEARDQIRHQAASYLEGRVMGGIAYILQHLDRIDESRTYATAVLARYRRAGDRLREAMALNGLGTLYQRQKNTEQALSHYQKALTIFRAIGTFQREAMVLYHMGHLLWTQGDSAQAFDCFTKAVDNCRMRNDRRWEGIILELYAMHRAEQDPDDALPDVLRAKMLLEETNSPRSLLNAHCTHIEILLSQGEHAQAQVVLAEAAQLSARAQIPADSSHGQRLQRCQTALNDSESAAL
ncbi:MAG: tetratricopeptide repeat protein [Myxococcota bacterium]